MNKQTIEEKKQGEIVSFFRSLKPESIQQVLLERSKQAALAFGVALLEADAEELCGPRYARKGDELCYRGGSEGTMIVVGGAQQRVRRPRVHNEDGEVTLPTLAKLRDHDLLDRQMQGRLLLGVSTRNYDKVISSYSKKLGTSKSSVSRAFIRVRQKDLDAINEGDLGSYTFVGILMDGIEIAGRSVVAAVGITASLEKVPLGLKEGDTENADVVRDLLGSLQERHFTLREYKSLAEWLEQISPDAASSLQEAGMELLTLHKLGIAGELCKSLYSTNAIESLFSVVRTGRVKNWRCRASNQIMRWVATNICKHKQKMRRLRGKSQTVELIAALGQIQTSPFVQLALKRDTGPFLLCNDRIPDIFPCRQGNICNRLRLLANYRANCGKGLR